MAKMQKRKKKNFRLRRSVRRTLGALFLMTAIIVAAIPFPDAAAVEEVDVTLQAEGDDAGITAPDYAALVKPKEKETEEDKVVNKGVTLTQKTDVDTSLQKFYLLRQMTGQSGQKTWRYEIQFTYYPITIPGALGTGAILNKYNNVYQNDNIILPDTVTTNTYVKVLKSEFDKWFIDNKDNSLTVTQTDVNENNRQAALFKYYFPSIYNKFIEQLKETTPQTQVTAKVSDLSPDLQLTYYCEFVGFNGELFRGKDVNGIYTPEYSLVIAEEPKGTDRIIHYMLWAGNNTEVPAGYTILSTDNRFVYKTTSNTYDLVGIAEEAFKDVENSFSITVPGMLKYIGDSAFENSSITSIKCQNVEDIGNFAFRNSSLSSVEFNAGTKKIGKEAFRKTELSSVSFPTSLGLIGKGAFSHNENLQTIKFDARDLVIDNCAFYECPKLSSQDLAGQDIIKIGAAAFALTGEDRGVFTSFKFPDSIVSGDDLGDHIFYKRTSLGEVRMPANLGYGNGKTATLKNNIFGGCVQLSCVEFPDTAYNVSYPATMFSQVINENFYVKGPKMDLYGQTEALPRKSTWVAKMNGGTDAIPYMFVENGRNYYEVGDGTYIKLIDDQGILQSVQFIDKTGTELIDFTIEGTVGNRTVVGIADGCLTPEFLQRVKKVIIRDDVEIKNIGNAVFADSPELQEVYIGDKVESLGNEIFKNCNKLTTATIGKSINKIGDEAFKGCENLSYITFNKPDNPAAFPISNIGKDAFQIDENENNDAKLIFEGIIDPNYGPYAYAMNPDTFINKNMGIRVCYRSGDPEGFTVLLDNQNNYPTLVDYRTYSDLGSVQARDINGDPITLLEKVNSKDEASNMTAMETYIVDAIYNVKIPKGIKSIDVKGYMTDKSQKTEDAAYAGMSNAINVLAYLSPTSGTKAALQDKKYDSYLKYGLFNGDYPDEEGDTNLGNDVVRTIVMDEVKYLPNTDEGIIGDDLYEAGLSGGAFHDCDSLTGVNLGGSIEDLGELPFLSDYNMEEVLFTDSAGTTSSKFLFENGIIYENLEDGTKKIIQALGSRGANQDGRVSIESDPHLENTSELAKGAFADIPQLASVNFEGNTILREVSDYTFFNDPLLSRVTLPDSLRIIGEHAFGNCGAGMDVYIYGKEVSMATTAFDNTPNPTVYTYEDTAAYNTAVKVVGPNNVEKIPEGFRVQFFDYDGITALTDIQYVEQGKNAEPPEEEPKRDGYIFTGWNKSYKDIQAHTDIIALYDIDPNGPYGGGNGGVNKPGEGNDGVEVPGGVDLDGDGKPDMDENGNKLYTLTVSNGTGGGRYPAGKKVAIQAGAAPDGAGFTHWSSTNTEVIFNDATKPSTTLTMPAADTTVVCNFAGYYRLDVVYGSGSGSYPAGAKIEISAVDAPQGRSFASWRSSTSGLTIENSRKQTTTVTMPKSNATVTATYMDNGSLSGNSTNKNSNNGTKVQITKPGIPSKDKASAYVSGSSDNFIVKISESAEATEAVQKALQAKYPDMTRVKYFAMDISLYDATGTKKITDTTGLKINITIPIPEALVEYAGNNKMAAVVNGQIEDLAPKFVTIDGVPCISFTATHFSPYTVYVDTANLTVTNTLDTTPKTGDGIHPKWFFSLGLACISMILFLKKDKRYVTKLS